MVNKYYPKSFLYFFALTCLILIGSFTMRVLFIAIIEKNFLGIILPIIWMSIIIIFIFYITKNKIIVSDDFIIIPSIYIEEGKNKDLKFSITDIDVIEFQIVYFPYIHILLKNNNDVHINVIMFSKKQIDQILKNVMFRINNNIN